MLQTLKLFTTSGETPSGEVLWAVRVRYHSLPFEIVLDQMREFPVDTVGFELSHSVLDVIKYSDDDDDISTLFASRGNGRNRRKKVKLSSQMSEAYDTMRHLVLGVWKGPNSTPAIESLAAAHTLPSTPSVAKSTDHHSNIRENQIELETWHETTLTAMSLCALAARRLLPFSSGSGPSVGSPAYHILLIGASLSAVASLLLNLCNHNYTESSPVHVTLLECDAAVMKTVCDFFKFIPVIETGESVCANSKGSSFVSGMSITQFVGAWQLSKLPQNCDAVMANSSSFGSPYDAIIAGSNACTDPILSVDTWHDLLGMLHPSGILAVHGLVSCIQDGVFRSLQTALARCNETAEYSRKLFAFSECQLGGNIRGRFINERNETRDSVFVCWPEKLSGGQRSISMNWWQQHIEDSHLLERLAYLEAVMESNDMTSTAPLAMDVFSAQSTSAILIPSFLTEAEAMSIHTLAGKRVAADPCSSIAEGVPVKTAHRLGREIRSRTSSLWEVLFLQTDGAFATALPDIREKALAVVREIDTREQWGLLTPIKSSDESDGGPWEVSCRVVEYHTQVAPTDGLRDIYHYDQDSLITLDVMLSDPGEDFTGGEVQTLDKDSSTNEEALHTHDNLRRLDALCFVSHKYHCVRPVISGTRRVLVFEFWRGSPSDRTCPHRCLKINRICELDNFSETTITTLQSEHTDKDYCHSERRVPFRLAAVSSVVDENLACCDNNLCMPDPHVWGGHWTLLWQAGDAFESVDDRPPIVIAPLDSTATKQLEDMFGDDGNESDD